MSTTYSRFAALRPANTDEQDLYTTVAGEFVGVVHICNQDTSTRTYRVALTASGSGVAASNEDWLEYDTTIQPNTSHKVTIEGMNSTATIRVKASVADKLSFIFMGVKKV